jgi:NTE family protein
MKQFRIALSGSGFKFPAHGGALAAIYASGGEIIELAGTSGGSIIAALHACGMSRADMVDLTMSRDWSDMMGFSPLALLRLGYCNGKNMLSFLTSATAGKTFGDLSIGLTIMTTDVTNGCPFEFSKANTPDAPVALAARASASIPFVYQPVEYKGRLLMDGGCLNNVPLDKLTIDAVPRIGVHLVSREKPLSPGVHTIFDIAPRIIGMILDANDHAHTEIGELEGAKAAFVETGYASGMDRNMPQDIRHRLFADGFAGVKSLMSA